MNSNWHLRRIDVFGGFFCVDWKLKNLGVEHLTPVNVKIAKLREALESVAAEQNYLKARDFRHRISEFPLVYLP
jgi:hypothetical protein